MKAIYNANNEVLGFATSIAAGVDSVEISNYDPVKHYQDNTVYEGALRFTINPSTGEVTERTVQEMEATEGGQEGKFSKVRDLILTRLALQEVIGHGSVPQSLKNRAQTRLTAVNQELADILGL